LGHTLEDQQQGADVEIDVMEKTFAQSALRYVPIIGTFSSRYSTLTRSFSEFVKVSASDASS
jgi:hypothetical protein